ncbi:MAG: A/G-specific adenine glycosylase [Candidatus Omnitrophota bacterium]
MKTQLEFSKRLISWYKKESRDLPWRHTSDPYKIWISEIMLQQTVVNAVIPYYKRWIKEFPSVEDVAKASLQKILKSWQGLGYYSRARNIHKTAKIICEKFKGRIPDTYDQLRSLPGFGPYTTGAVLSIAFNKRFPIIDANVRRVIMRQLALKGFADTSHDKKILRFLEEIMPQREMNIFNQALMELGALVCRSKEVLCNVCPVKEQCRAYKKGIQEIIPTPKLKNIKKIDVAVAIIKRGDKYFIQKRPSKGLLADLWEFPGGKIEKGETPSIALIREMKEELSLSVRSTKYLFKVAHFYTQFRVRLHVFLCHPEAFPRGDSTHKWVSSSQFQQFPMPSGSAKIVDKLHKKIAA